MRDKLAHDSGSSALKVLTVLRLKMRKCRFGEYTGMAEFRLSELGLKVFVLDGCRRREVGRADQLLRPSQRRLHSHGRGAEHPA